MIAEDEKNLIQNDRFLILVDNRGQKRLIKPSDHKNFKWRKMPIKLGQLDKYEYYQTLEVGNDKISAVQSSQSEPEVQDLGDDQNNKEIYTSEQAQKLQAEQINEMKNKKNAQEIISAIVSNNEQFEKRTAYSKQKYLAKKKKKYLFRFHAQPTCLESVHKYYYNEDPKSVSWMRQDQLGFLLLHGSPYNKVLLAQQTKGILLGALLIREAKNITCVSQETKNMKRFPIVQQLNIQKSITQERVNFTQWRLLKECKQTFSNVIFAGNYDFKELTQLVLDLMQPNCIVCYYCIHLQPLRQVLQFLKTKQQIVHYKLHDSWAREYQVLKNRTHPQMYMHGHSGYLLTAIKVSEMKQSN